MSFKAIQEVNNQVAKSVTTDLKSIHVQPDGQSYESTREFHFGGATNGTDFVATTKINEKGNVQVHGYAKNAHRALTEKEMYTAYATTLVDTIGEKYGVDTEGMTQSGTPRTLQRNVNHIMSEAGVSDYISFGKTDIEYKDFQAAQNEVLKEVREEFKNEFAEMIENGQVDGIEFEKTKFSVYENGSTVTGDVSLQDGKFALNYYAGSTQNGTVVSKEAIVETTSNVVADTISDVMAADFGSSLDELSEKTGIEL